MAGRNTTTRRRANGRDAESPPAEPDQVPDPSDPFADLRSIQSGDMLSVTRQTPSEHAGWLDDIEVPEGTVDEVRGIIRERWGGGRYHLQWKKRGADNARLRFAKGSAVITISAPAKLPTDVVAGVPPGVQYVAAPQPAANPSTGDAVANRLLEMLGGFVSRVPEGAQANIDFVGLVQALRQEIDPGGRAQQPQADMFGGFDRFLGIMERMEERIAARLENAGGASSAKGVTGMPAHLETMIAQKFLTDQPGQQPAGPQGPQPSPNHLWHPVHGWVPAQPLRPRAPQPPPPGPPPGPRPGPPPGPPSAPQSSPAAAPAPEAPPPTSTEQAEEWAPDELADEVSAMSPEDQRKFMSRIMEKMGGTPDELAAMFKGPQPPPASDVPPYETGYPNAVDGE